MYIKIAKYVLVDGQTSDSCPGHSLGTGYTASKGSWPHSTQEIEGK